MRGDPGGKRAVPRSPTLRPFRNIFRCSFHAPAAVPALLHVADAVIYTHELRYQSRHPTWLLDYNFEDAGRYRVGGPCAPWRTRPARTAHVYAPRNARWEDTRALTHPWHAICVLFQDAERTDIAALLHPRLLYAAFLDPNGALALLLRQLVFIVHTYGQREFWHAQAVFCQILAALRQSERVDETTWRLAAASHPPPVSNLVAAANAYFHEHLAERIVLPTLARHLGVNPNTLSHRYRRETGEALMQGLIRLRVARAKDLLQAGHPLKTVAEQTGFCDPYHFSKTFKRIARLSPGDFRRLSVKATPTPGLVTGKDASSNVADGPHKAGP